MDARKSFRGAVECGTRILRVIHGRDARATFTLTSPLDRAFFGGVDLRQFGRGVKEPFHVVH